VQMHPFRQLVLHLDFQRVEADTKLKMKVPMHFSGQETSPAFKLDNCLITHVLNELEITCAPADLPEFIAVDLSQLKKGTSLHASDIVLPKGVKVVKHGTNNPVVVSVVAQAAEEAPAADATAAPAADAKDAKKAPAKK
jgi:large subunit ribosomal protein L25